MSTKIRRFAAATVLPAALMLTFTACGDDSESETDSSESTTTDSTEETESTDTETTEGTEGDSTDSSGMPGDIPDPVEDPEGFEAYIASSYTDAGLTQEQADCAAGAFMDNVDVESLTDSGAISEMMSDPKLQEAMTACMS